MYVVAEALGEAWTKSVSYPSELSEDGRQWYSSVCNATVTAERALVRASVDSLGQLFRLLT